LHPQQNIDANSESTGTIEVNVDELQQIPSTEETATTARWNSMRWQIAGVVGTLLCVAVVAGVIIAVIYTKVSNSDDYMFFISLMS
jgi:hypothetical protein